MTVCNANNKKYIGKEEKVKDNYLGSGNLIRDALLVIVK